MIVEQYILYQQYDQMWHHGGITLPDERDNSEMGTNDIIEGLYYTGDPEWGLYSFDSIKICQDRSPFGSLGSVAYPGGMGDLIDIPFDPPDESWTYDRDVSFWDWQTLVLGSAFTFNSPVPVGDDYYYSFYYNPYFNNPGWAYTITHKSFHVYTKDVDYVYGSIVPSLTALGLLFCVSMVGGTGTGRRPHTR